MNLDRISQSGTGTADIEDAGAWDAPRQLEARNPEQDLMLAVLKDALLNYRKTLFSSSKRADEDREWFFSVDSDRLFAFESVCSILGLDAQRIRKHLLHWEREVASRRRRIGHPEVLMLPPHREQSRGAHPASR